MVSALHTDLLAIVGVRTIEKLDAREGAGELSAAGDPRDGGALVKEEAGVEELDAFLLDEAHAQHLALLLIRDQLCGQHLQAHIHVAALCIQYCIQAQVVLLHLVFAASFVGQSLPCKCTHAMAAGATPTQDGTQLESAGKGMTA